MKKITLVFIAFIALINFTACSDDDGFTFTAKPDPEGIAFTNSTLETYNLTASNSANIAERFVWNAANFNVQTPVNYEVQGSSVETFESFSVIGVGTQTNQAVTVANMLALAKEVGLDNDPTTAEPNTGSVYFRVRAYVGADAGNVVEQLSEVLTISVTLPEEAEENLDLPKLFVVGNFLSLGGYGSDWTPADAVPLAASAEGNTDYEGFVFINSATPEFKFLPTNEAFDGDYGDTGADNGTFSGTIEQEGEVNAGTPDGTGGYYLVNVDTNALTYDLTETSWGVIGNATPTGWDSDTDMVYDSKTKIWSVTLDLTEQEAPNNGIKFRANDAWEINFGDTDADGSLEFNTDQNIGVPADGNYTITLDLSNPRQYKYSISKN
ncbi:SusE domain-containing protein [Leeuwenhoekiella sp. MAR_2009_132]|uniref:SusE domain-containing protein n=1 Tax=Leeuwenhoekiella sp. MAR_2009_132 TaxID=1392489 RepID=UPI00048D08F9|nr:SusE domain-containing protein [Leeuwenhoekiella sp. MAR_2009_132]